MSASDARAAPRFREHPLEWALQLFADVRAGEALTLLVLTANVFALLTAYYLLKVAREPLILMGGGAEVKSYAAAGQSFLLIFVASAYGWLAQKVDRMRLIATVTLFFVANLVAFFALGTRNVPLGVPFYLWVGIFSVTVIAQFWAFAADVYTPEQGKRLFPVVGIGSSVGAFAGATIAKRLVFIGPYALMLVAGGILVACLGLTLVVHRRETTARTRARRVEEPMGDENGFALLLRDRYLFLVGALAFILNWVNTTGEYVLDRTLLAAAEAGAAGAGQTPAQFIGEFKAEYFQWVNVAGVALQLFAVSRILKYVGVRRALLLMPAVSLLGYSALAFVPMLSLIFVAKIAENSLDYSLSNTARQALWLVADRGAKYKAKQVVDTFLMRAGDVMSAVVVWVGAQVHFRTVHFIGVNIALVLVWGGVLVLLAREHRKREPDAHATDASAAAEASA